MKKLETVDALIVRLVGLPKPAVLNALRVVQVHLALDVKIVHWALREKETTMMRLNAYNVN